MQYVYIYLHVPIIHTWIYQLVPTGLFFGPSAKVQSGNPGGFQLIFHLKKRKKSTKIHKIDETRIE